MPKQGWQYFESEAEPDWQALWRADDEKRRAALAPRANWMMLLAQEPVAERQDEADPRLDAELGALDAELAEAQRRGNEARAAEQHAMFGGPKFIPSNSPMRGTVPHPAPTPVAPPATDKDLETLLAEVDAAERRFRDARAQAWKQADPFAAALPGPVAG